MVTLTRVPHSRPTTSLWVRESTIGRSHPGPMRPVSHVRRRLSNGYGMFLLFGKQNKHVLSTRQHTRQLTNLPCDRWVGPTPTQKTVLELATSRAYKTEKKRDIRSPPLPFDLFLILICVRPHPTHQPYILPVVTPSVLPPAGLFLAAF